MEQFKRSLKDSAGKRWAILFLIAFVQAANYYFYDAISPLKRLLEDHFNFTSSDFGLFVAAYSIPNTFLLMAVLGGIILDKLGIRRTGFMFVGMMAIGGLLTAYGASEYFSNGGFGYSFLNSFLTDYSPELKMMILGRFFFGLGAETSIVVVSKVIVKWFKGKELALAFGLKIGLARAGSALALFYSADIAAAASHWTIAIWFAAILLLVAFLAFLVYSIFDVKIDKQQSADVKLLKKEDNFSFTDLKRLLTNKSFIYVTLLCVTFYSAVFPFQAFSPDFLLNKFGMGLSESGKIASLLYWVTMFATPLFGLVVDRFGRSATLMIFGSVLLTLIHLTFAITYFNPVIPLLLLGIAIALVPAAMWPSVAKIVAEKRIGSAYGAMFSVQNLGLFLFPILAGLILDTTNKNAEIYLSPQQTREIRESKIFTASYLDNRDEAIENKQLLSSLSLYHLPDTLKAEKEEEVLEKQVNKYGELMWTEYFHAKSGRLGTFTDTLGTDSTERINMKFFRIDPQQHLLVISTTDSLPENLFTSKQFETDTAGGFLKFDVDIPQRWDKLIKQSEKINVTLMDTSANNIILAEEHDVYINKKGQLSLKLGQGKIDYLNWSDNTVIKIRTPLDYTWAILMFAALGLFGLVFAILLKREDKKAGYGLELPSNVKAKNTE
ncbi:MAG: MFS transporter [Bacteroidales bacterium]|nr:MFS transporter [Bacteroidales bacterium]MCF8351580.1 MFS transporter [Bacteroidales bacterium]MCF8376636.1 MFS transporter [Bacteroidales bacterium]MCF8400642.1 MFS transporter [Bacteroidales bacterium]